MCPFVLVHFASLSSQRERKKDALKEICTSVSGLCKCFPDRWLVPYLQKRDDKRSEGEVGRFLQLRVEFFYG